MKIGNEFGVRVIWFRRMVNAVWNSEILNSTNLSLLSLYSLCLYSLADASRMWLARTSGSVPNLLECVFRCSWECSERRMPKTIKIIRYLSLSRDVCGCVIVTVVSLYIICFLFFSLYVITYAVVNLLVCLAAAVCHWFGLIILN